MKNHTTVSQQQTNKYNVSAEEWARDVAKRKKKERGKAAKKQ